MTGHGRTYRRDSSVKGHLGKVRLTCSQSHSQPKAYAEERATDVGERRPSSPVCIGDGGKLMMLVRLKAVDVDECSSVEMPLVI